jgi:cytidyltransferase-like protein
MDPIIVSGSFDGISSNEMRFLYETSQRGIVHVDLWSDTRVASETGTPPKCPLAERQYAVESLRYVAGVAIDSSVDGDALTVPESDSSVYPLLDAASTVVDTGRPKVMVTGCYDWFHSGHVRFFEEVSEHGDLYVVIGNDANVEFLKGEGHPMFKQDERLFMVQSIKYVTYATVATGTGWVDAAPEVARIRPEKYAVNEDGDRPEKRQFCDKHGLEYVVLKRTPKKGLTARNSTNLRGF